VHLVKKSPAIGVVMSQPATLLLRENERAVLILYYVRDACPVTQRLI